MTVSSSNLFESYRTIGLVCDDIPFALNKLGSDSFITVSIGSAFMVYDVDRLVVRLVSKAVLKKNISGLVSAGRDLTICSSGQSIFLFKRAHLQKTIVEGGHGGINGMYMFGSSLIAFSSTKVLCVQISDEEEELKTFTLGTSRNPRTPSCVVHPHTYLNKVLVGTTEGALELWNIRSGKRVYEFKGFNSAVVCMEQSPAVDVIAVGLSDGRIILLNIRLDEVIMEFEHKGGSITSIAFRSDSGRSTAASFPMMVTGSACGTMSVWNLDEKRHVVSNNDAHDGAISKLQFIPNEPLLVSSGVDNRLQVFIFDQEDSSPRLLRSRHGHKDAPTRIRYFGGDVVSSFGSGGDASCCQILSAGRDRAFRVFHTNRDQLNREMSQGNVSKKAKAWNLKVEELKLPPIIDFATAEARKKDWCNVLSAHANESGVFTWQLENRVIGNQVLRPDGRDSGMTLKKLQTDKITMRSGSFPAALCVAISSCGNYGVVGTGNGSIYKYNMQSGLLRGSFPKNLDYEEPAAKRRKEDPASISVLLGGHTTKPQLNIHDRHNGPVHGIAVDTLNQTVISAGFDGFIKFWNFLTHQLETTIELDSPVAQLVMCRDANIFAVSCDDFSIRVFDATTRGLIRKFVGHRGCVTDMAFSKDARWLASCSADTSLRIWDLPTARCIDWVEFPSAVTGVTFSPTGEFLATSFAGSVGISLWANKAYFGVATASTIASRPTRMHVPAPMKGSSSSFIENDPDNESSDSETEGDDTVSDADSELESTELLPPVGAEGMLQFSGQAVSKWYALAHLDIIKARNKPIEPPSKPEQAPFFLPSTKSVNPVFKKVEPVTEDAAPVLEGAGDWSEDDNEDASTESAGEAAPEAVPEYHSRIVKSNGFAKSRSELFRLLELAAAHHAVSEVHGFADVVSYVHSVSPSAIDFELRTCSLGPEDDDGVHLLYILCKWLVFELKNKSNFELVQAMISRLIDLHSETIVVRDELQEVLNEILVAQQSSWKGLKGMLQHNICLLSYFAHQI